MSQGTPRKFSEKIAIMERKQTEDAEAFKNVMQEVRPLTTLQPMSQHPSTSQGGLAIPPGWGRPGGSLPNVHEMMVQHPTHHVGVMQMPPGANDPGMMGWGTLGVSPWLDSSMMDPTHAERVMHSPRGRSPGAHPHQHFHPYRAGGPSQMSPGVAYPHRHASQERIGLEYPLHYPGVMPGAPNLLQPPDAQWRKARSDPAIHMNAYRQPSISSQGSAGSSPHSPNEYTPPQDISPPVSTGPFAVGDVSQVSNFYMDASKSAQNHVDMKQPNSCDPVLNYNSPIASPGQDLISSSPGGSLPNLPSPLRNQQPNFGYPPSYVEAVNHQQVHHSGHSPIQQRHSIQLPPGGAGYPPGQMGGYNLAATPPYSAESQSAPTSPADANASVASPGSTYEIQNQMQNIQLQQQNEPRMMQQQQQQQQQQQWAYSQGQQQFYPQHQPLQRYNSSTSPDVMGAPSPNGSGGQIPNIVLYGADGSISGHQNQIGDNLADCFGDLQDLRLDPQLQQLLSSSDNQVDPASERALCLDRD